MNDNRKNEQKNERSENREDSKANNKKDRPNAMTATLCNIHKGHGSKPSTYCVYSA